MAAVEADVLRGGLANDGMIDAGTVTATREQSNARNKAIAPINTSGALQLFLQRPAVRKTLPYIGTALVLLLAVMAYISLATPPPRSLYPDMADADKEAAQQLLQKNGINVRLDPTTGTLTVPAAEFHEARIVLAAAGLPKDASGGSSVLKDPMPLGTSQFMEQARYNATIEEELAQSIRRINTIQNARVHLALPRQSAFISGRVDPKASVIVTPYAGRTLSEGQVQAIVHLVSSSIPYMNPAGVSVVDQFGRLLTEAQGAKDLNAKQLELRQKIEADYVDRINQILAPIFGMANVRAQVSADLDFSVIEQTEENFDPSSAGTKIRSEQLMQKQTTEPRASGVPGSLSNDPPDAAEAVADANLPAEDAEQPAANADNAIRGQESSQSRNYEMDRRVKYVIDPAPRMRRLTVGIAINDAIAQAQTTTAPARRPIPDTELTRLTSLVQGAVGFNSARGDIVNIISTSFEPPRAETPLPIWQQPRYLELAQYISVALAIALLALLVVRPVINRITHIPQTELSREQMLVALSQKGVDVSTLSGSTDGAAGALSDAAPADNVDGAAANESKEGDVELREGETLEELKARLKPRKKTAISAEMLDTANSYDDKVTVVRMMVSQDAKRVALVLKNLITKDIR